MQFVNTQQILLTSHLTGKQNWKCDAPLWIFLVNIRLKFILTKLN